MIDTIGRLMTHASKAGRLAAEGLGILRLRPALLLVPLALAVANGVDSAVYSAWAVRTYGGDYAAYAPQTPLIAARDFFSPDLGSYALGLPITGVSFTFTESAVRNRITIDARGRARPDVRLQTMLLLEAAFAAVGIALTALVLAGYYGTVAGAVLARSSPERRFWKSARMHWGRFSLYGLLLWFLRGYGIAFMSSVALVLRHSVPALAGGIWHAAKLAFGPWSAWVQCALSVVLAFTLWAVVVDNRSFLGSAWLSAKIVVLNVFIVAGYGVHP